MRAPAGHASRSPRTRQDEPGDEQAEAKVLWLTPVEGARAAPVGWTRRPSIGAGEDVRVYERASVALIGRRSMAAPRSGKSDDRQGSP